MVAEVLIKLNKRDKNLPEHLVKIQDCVEDVMRLLDEGFPDVHYLVIHGMGGISKTTLTKVVFNQISSRFHGCCFRHESNCSGSLNGPGASDLAGRLLHTVRYPS